MKKRVVYFCGHRSDYSMAHLEPILSNFDVLAVVIATDERWRIFIEGLTGKVYRYERRRDVLKKYIARLLRVLRASSSNKTVSIERLLKNQRIPVLKVHDVNDQKFLDGIKSKFNPELIISAGYPQLFSKELVTFSRGGAVNFHPSLLPKFRGAHPHFWTIAKGEKYGGITAHYMTENIDDGDLIAQLPIPIEGAYYSDYCKEIYKTTPDLVRMVRDYLDDETSVPLPQDPKSVSYFRNDREIHRKIFWRSMKADEICNLVRTENSFFVYKNKKVVIHRAKVVKTNRNMTNKVSVDAGTVVDMTDDGLFIAAKEYYVQILSLYSRGKVVSHREWIKKNGIFIGVQFI